MKPRDLTARKLGVLNAAADRWQARAPQVAEAARRLRAGGPAAAASPERVERFRAREAVKRAVGLGGIGYERKIGDALELDDVPPDDRSRTAGRPVARVVELFDGGRIGEGFATGFLVRPGLLVTNWHVFADRDDARGCGAQFGFERNAAGFLDNGVVFELDPDAFFLSDVRLDVAFVALRAAAGSGVPGDYGAVRLIPTTGKILVGHPVSVIQHPDGRHKHWGVRQNKLLLDPADGDLFLTYSTDTLEGSSGSPAFNYDWELVAVHHSGVPRKVNGQIVTRTGAPWRPGMPDSDIDWVANEGARVSKIHAFLTTARVAGASQQALLAALIAGAADPVLSESANVPDTSALTPASAVATSLGHLSGGAMNVIVNGTANFYVNTGDRPAAGVPAVRPIPGVITTVGREKKLKFDPDYDNRPGYRPDFLAGFVVPAPKGPAAEVLKQGNKALVLDYHHYSLVMHEKRRLVMWAAANVDYDPNKRWRSRDDFGDDTWKPDPRILITSQIEDLEFYEPARKFDRGHIVRRDDVAWGEDMREEEFGNSDSFHWTNCTPQHEHFNRDMFQYNGLWGQLENHIAREAGFLDNRLILLAGPVLSQQDPRRDFGSGIKVKVPKAFWKVVVAVEETAGQRTLRAYGFVLDQSDAIAEHGWEARFRVGIFEEQQVSLAEITQRSRVTFDDLLHAADPLAHDPNEARGRPLRTLDDVRLR